MNILAIFAFISFVAASKVEQTDSEIIICDNPKVTKQFKKHPNLVFLVIKNCGLGEIENGKWFEGLPNLRVLNVTRDNFSKLNGTEFSTLTSLEVLNLKLNRVREISSSELNNLRNLKHLFLDENEIQIIDKMTFLNNVQLETISLSTNDIAKLHYKTFSTLIKLREIDLSMNSLTSLQTDVFEQNINLERLDLNNNNLQHIGPSIFITLSKLISADFEGNPCVTGWISSTNIVKLNETISLNCPVTDAVAIEWQKDTIEELKNEIKLKTYC